MRPITKILAIFGICAIAFSGVGLWLSFPSVTNVRRLTPVGLTIELNVTKYSRMPGASGMLSIDGFISARGDSLLIHRTVLSLDESAPESLPNRVREFRWDAKRQALHVTWSDATGGEVSQEFRMFPAEGAYRQSNNVSTEHRS